MVNRRRFLSLCTALVTGSAARATTAGTAAPATALMTDDGLYSQPWFLQSFLDLAEDLEESAGQGKRFAIMWGQKGCPYCQESHLVNFAQPEIQEFVSGNFDILQLNLFGSREVTDFDGEQLEERELARKYRVRFTPTVQFFPADVSQVAGKSGKEAEVARMPGYLRPPHFLAMFKFVEEEAYRETNFRQYVKRQAQ